MKTDTLLVALDITGCAAEVVGHTSDLANKLGAAVTLLHVTDTPAGVEPHDHVPTKAHPEGIDAIEAIDDEAKGLLAEFAGMLVGQGVETTVVVAHGEPAATINRVADQLDADMIVTGTRGRTGLRRWVMGSVAEEVVRHATRPVLVLHSSDLTAHPGLTPATRQMLAEADG